MNSDKLKRASSSPTDGRPNGEDEILTEAADKKGALKQAPVNDANTRTSHAAASF
jgi:hypothetical protein